MRAAVLPRVGDEPAVGEFNEPTGEVVEVRLAGANPVDLAIASGEMATPMTPSVVGQEGIGVTVDGERIYFNSPPEPFGSWAQRCPVDPRLVFPVPDALDDDVAVALGIAGLAAWMPLTWHANVENGESVLVLGATGIVGRIAVQAAKLLGAGRVVGAGRNRGKLERVGELGADATVVLGDNAAEALQAEAGDGYDVVIDTVYGKPFLAALAASAPGATLVTIGQGAGFSADITFAALMGRTHVGHFNNTLAPEVLHEGYRQLTDHASAGRIRVETQRYGLEEATTAWQELNAGPDTKLAVVP